MSSLTRLVNFTEIYMALSIAVDAPMHRFEENQARKYFQQLIDGMRNMVLLIVEG